ncbi:MAG TPA: hypothetical protein PLS49_04010 [Candidatus Woesebacteria bacterium]|nr:hypothetical protein [Candidatus Woesebacteria bacterium]
MSAVPQDLQLEREPQYINEQIMPEAQLLERPLTIMSGFQQAAEEGIVSQMADNISLAHLPNPGFKITHEFNPDTKIEPNDGKAAIVAGICGVTRSCEDRCCPIGDLEKARVRVGLINELKLNDPDFFNNPNADKIIKERVEEVMQQRQNDGNIEIIKEQQIDQTNVEANSEQKKPKKEIPTGFFGKQLTPEEAKQKMAELSGTYSQGKKIDSETPAATSTVEIQQPERTVTSVSKPSEMVIEKPVEQMNKQTTQNEPEQTVEPKIEVSTPPVKIQQPEQKLQIPNHIKKMMQDRIKSPIDAAPLKQVSPTSSVKEQPVSISTVEIQHTTSSSPEILESQSIKQEYVAPVVPQSRINRHKPIAELNIPKQINENSPINSVQSEMVITQPKTIESSTVRQVVQPDIQVSRGDNSKPLEQLEQKPKDNSIVEIAEQIFTFPDIPNTISPHTENQTPRIEQIVTDIADMPKTETINLQAQVMEQTIHIPVQEIPLIQIETIHKPVIETQPIAPEQKISTIQVESNQQDQSIQFNTPLVNEIKPPSPQTEEIAKSVMQNETTHSMITNEQITEMKSIDTTITVFSYKEQTQHKSEPVIDSEEVTISIEINSNHTEPTVTELHTVKPHKDQPEESEQNAIQQINTEIPSEQSEEILQPAHQDSLTQLLTTIIAESPIEQTIRTANENSVSISKPDKINTQIHQTNIDISEHIEPSNSEVISTDKIEFMQNDTPQNIPELITLNITEQELPEQITEILQNRAQEPTIILALPNLSESMLENNEEPETFYSNQNVEKAQPELEEKKLETFFIQMMNQEQTVDFFYLIQDITDILALLHNQNQEEVSEYKPDSVGINEVAPEELKNDTFGKYDDTVVQTVWPIIQFMLFIQNMQIFIPQNQRITQHNSEFVSGSSFNLQQSHVFQHAL